jgi:hypothetical protein
MSSAISTALDLCRLLEREEAACNALLDTVHQERAAIRALAVAEFHPINSRRLAVLESLQTLADERLQLVRQFGRENGLFDRTVTLQGILDQAQSPLFDEIRRRYGSYMATAKLVREEIKQNAVLIEGIRGFLDSAMSAGANAAPGLDLYNGGGRSAATQPSAALIHQRG